MTYIESWPAEIRDLTDPTRPLTAHQLRPDLTDAFTSWSGGEQLVVNGGPAVLLPGDDPTSPRLVGLGDLAVRDHTGRTWAEPAAGFWQRYTPTEEGRPGR